MNPAQTIEGTEDVATPRDHALRLAHLGLDADLESTYLIALERPSWTAADLGTRLGLDASTTARAARRLAELGLLTCTDTADVIRPLNPQLGLAALLAEHEAELARRSRDLERTRVAAADIAAKFITRLPVPDGPMHRAHAETVTSPAAAQGAVQALIRSATSEILIMSAAATARPDPITGLRELEPDQLRPFIRCHVLLPDAARTDPLLSRRIRHLAQRGVVIRTAATIPMSGLVVDGATLAVPADRASCTGVSVLRLGAAVTAMTELFDRIWHIAIPLGQSAPVDHVTGLSPREREVLRVLSDGGTDESAAAKLGVSARTIRRMVSDVMGRLGARSRFQAGIKAAERGWLVSQ